MKNEPFFKTVLSDFEWKWNVFSSFNESHCNDEIFQNNETIDVFDKCVICFEWKEWNSIEKSTHFFSFWEIYSNRQELKKLWKKWHLIEMFLFTMRF